MAINEKFLPPKVDRDIPPVSEKAIPCVIVVDNLAILQSSGIEPIGIKDDNNPAL